MDLGSVIVLLLTLVAVIFLVFLEKHSRSNDAKLKAQASAPDAGTQPPVASHPETARRKKSKSR